MNLILVLIVGGLIGWVASMIMRTDAQQGLFLNIVVGVVGALIAGFLLGGGASILNAPLNLMTILWSLLGAVVLLAIVNRLSGASILNAPLNLMTILWSLLGAVVLLAIVNLIRRGAVR